MSWDTEQKNGKFERKDRTFRDFITAGEGKFKAEPNRYHLYISYACPWASRTLAVRKLKGLEDVISYDVVDTFLDKSTGWSLLKKDKDANGDSVNGCQYLKEIYHKADPGYDQSVTVPVLWDKKLNTIVNNESSEIIRMLNTEFNAFAKNPSLDLYPQALRSKIDEINSWVYNSINNGVYKAGFATKQEAYEEAFVELFNKLDKTEEILSKDRYLCGNELTEADIRLFVTLIRFDPVYVLHFKCNKKRIIDYPNIWNYTKEIYQMPKIKDTVNFDHIKKHYFTSHLRINPLQIVPVGPIINFDEPHNRDQLFPRK